MSDLQDLLGIIGSIGNSAGVKGDGATGLNALQRASLPTEQQSALAQLNARANTDFSQPQQAVQQMYQSGNVSGQDAISALSNPNFQAGLVSRINNVPTAAASTAPAAPAPVAAPVAAPAQSAPAPQAQNGVNYNYLNSIKQISPAIGTMAENMIDGSFNMESGKGENDPIYNSALAVARRADPTFNPQSLIGRPAMVKNSTSGDMYKLGTSLNTGFAHLYDLHEMAPLTGNNPDSSPALNYIGSHVTTAGGLPGSQGISRYKATLSSAAPEIAKYLGGGAATDTGTEEAQNGFSPNLPADTIQTNAKDLGAKMMAKGGSLQQEYNTTMGSAGTKKVVQPMTEALYADMQGKALTPEQKKLVDEHRAESNLPLKYSKAAATPKADLSKITPEMARAELARRQAAKGQ